MSVSRVLKESLGKVLTAPSLVLWVFAMLLLLAVPASLAMRDLLSESIGASLVHEKLRQGFDLDWWGEFLFSNRGLADTFGPGVTGGLPLLTNLESFLDGRLSRLHTPIFLSGFFFLLFWVFIQGGILDRYARPDEPHSRARLFEASARLFFRMLRLAVVSVFGYWAIFIYVGAGLHSRVDRFFQDSTTERPILVVTMLVYVLLFLLWWVFSLGIDYAKVALVVERRRSAFFSTLRGFGFVLSHPLECFGIASFFLVLAWFFGITFFYFAPGPDQASWNAVLVAFVLSQLYLLLRIGTRLFSLAAETTLFSTVDSPPPPPHFVDPKPGEVYRKPALAPVPERMPVIPTEAEVVEEEGEAEGEGTEPEEFPGDPKP